MDVFDMPDEIILVANAMLHESPLPHTSPTLAALTLADDLLLSSQALPVPSEVTFDISPARREIGVAARQGPYHVQMIG